MTPKELALTNVPEAKRWATAAVGALNAIIGFSGTRSNISNLSQFKAAATHFHVSLGPPPGVVTRLLNVRAQNGAADRLRRPGPEPA
jgi:hypothetical protein